MSLYLAFMWAATFSLSAVAQPAGDVPLPNKTGSITWGEFRAFNHTSSKSNTLYERDTLHALQKRGDPVRVCGAARTSDTKDLTCIEWTDNAINEIGSAIGSQFYRMSSANQCGHYFGTYVDPKYPPVAFEISATNKDQTNTDCSTTAQQRTIAGGIQQYLRQNAHYDSKSKKHHKICEAVCLQLIHGDAGTWVGYISLTPNFEQYDPRYLDCTAQSANQGCLWAGGPQCEGKDCYAHPDN